MAAFLFALIFLFPQVSLAADYSNDSNSININYTGSEPDVLSGGSSGGGDGSGSTGGAGETGGGGGGGGATGGNGAPLPDTQVTVTVNATGGGDGSSEDGSATSGSDILSTLLGNQAVFFGSGGGAGGGGDVSLSAEDVRKALAARGVSKLTLSRFLSERFRTKGDFALAAASSILDNPSLEKVVLSARDLSLTYKATGRLLGVFPLAYPIRLEVHPYEKTPEARIGVKFPWYRFFLQTYVTKKQLQTELDAALSAALADTEETDQAARALLAISTAIQERFDTVEGTISER
jgi:hypothetical protein